VPGAPAGPGGGGRHRALRELAVPAVSVIVYFAVRPAVGSDTAGLVVAGAVPAVYTIAAVALRRRVHLWATATSVAYALGCAVSLLAGGNSLPLKLHEAAVTFLLGVVLLGAVLSGLGRRLRTGAPRRCSRVCLVSGHRFAVLFRYGRGRFSRMADPAEGLALVRQAKRV
jgi:hypothetical protein